MSSVAKQLRQCGAKNAGNPKRGQGVVLNPDRYLCDQAADEIRKRPTTGTYGASARLRAA